MISGVWQHFHKNDGEVIELIERAGFVIEFVGESLDGVGN